MKSFLKVLLFLCCLASLLISMHIFYNQGIVADELNLGAAQLYGGDLWLYMSWLRLLLLLIASAATFVMLLPRKKQ